MTAEVQHGTNSMEHRAQGKEGFTGTRVITTSTGSVIVPAQRSDARWQQLYTRRLWISDTIVLVWVVFGTQIF